MCEIIAAGTIYAFVACHLNLSWAYNGLAGWGFAVERCQGLGCSNFVGVGMQDRILNQVNYNFKDNQILAENTTYCYRVKAGYGAGIPSDWTYGPYSPISCAATTNIKGDQTPNRPINLKPRQP